MPKPEKKEKLPMPERTVNADELGDTMEGTSGPFATIYRSVNWRETTPEGTIGYLQKLGMDREEIKDQYGKEFLAGIARKYPTRFRLGKDSQDNWTLDVNQPKDDGIPIQNFETYSQLEAEQDDFMYREHKYDPTLSFDNLSKIIDPIKDRFQ